MQTNRKKIGLLLILVGLLLIILIIYFGFSKKTPTTTTTNITPAATSTVRVTVNGTTTPGDLPTGHQTYDLSKEAPHITNAGDLEKIGMAFAERFGSYSNQSDFGNFRDLKLFMTDNMKTWVDTYIAALKKSASTATGYSGQETHALSAKASAFDDKAGTAAVVVTVARSVSSDKIGGGQPQTAKLDLAFKKVNNNWLVDKAYWEK